MLRWVNPQTTHLHKKQEYNDYFSASKSIVKANRKGSNFTKDSEEMIDTMVAEYRGKYDLPFDELYHKEKGLVRAVVEAHKALKQKESKMKSLMANKFLDQSEFA